MLRLEGDLFLEECSLDDVRQALGVPVIPVGEDAQSLWDAVTGGSEET